MRGNKLTHHSDAPVFDDVYAAYSQRVLNLAYRMTGDEDTARDLTQEIFIKVFEKLETFKHRSDVYTWIYRIAVNHIYNYLKKERRRRWLGLLDRSVGDLVREPDAEPAFPTAREVPADRKLEESERAAVLWEAVQSLPPKYAVPLVLFNFEDMSYKQIANVLGLSLSAVEARIHRARKKLIKLLEPWIGRI
jgi:RNA polymerase sigma-70 factor (ECF subfamily)